MTRQADLTDQQKQTLSYFSDRAPEWQQKAYGAVPDVVNIIAQRNNYVIEKVKETGARQILDIGCGTGDLVLQLAATGCRAKGIDFAPEMIELCLEGKKRQALDCAEFECISVFDFDAEDGGLDMVSANGLIEYIAEHEFQALLKKTHRLLGTSGSIVLGSRNRLFNVFSLNKYTHHEITEGHAVRLLEEACLFAESNGIAECISLLESLHELPESTVPPFTGGTKIDVRYQYTPAQLVHLLSDAGFQSRGIHPVHYHSTVPRFAREHPQVHVAISELLQEFGHNHSLVPYSSSFMIHATKV